MPASMPAAVEAVTEGQDATPTWANSVQELVNALRLATSEWSPLTAVKSATESLSSQTLQDDDHIVVSGLSGITYSGLLTVHYTGDTTADMQFRLVASVASEITWAPTRLPVAATSTSSTTLEWGGERVTAATVTSTVSAGATTQVALLAMFVTWKPSADASVKFQWARANSSGTALQVLAGSSMVLHRIG